MEERQIISQYFLILLRYTWSSDDPINWTSLKYMFSEGLQRGRGKKIILIRVHFMAGEWLFYDLQKGVARV